MKRTGIILGIGIVLAGIVLGVRVEEQFLKELHACAELEGHTASSFAPGCVIGKEMSKGKHHRGKHHRILGKGAVEGKEKDIVRNADDKVEEEGAVVNDYVPLQEYSK